MNILGMMQGRLTQPKGRGIQFFPFEYWENEFEIGAKLGIQEIEWIFDYERYMDNPLWTDGGAAEIKDLIAASGVSVRSVCFDYFMRRPFYKTSEAERVSVRSENLEFVKRIIGGMKAISATLLEIPMVDDSSVKTEQERELMIDFLQDVLRLAEDADILVGCETDMPVGVFRDFLDAVGHPRIRANYDSGNSSGLGYDHAEEIHSLAEYIANVHIKDRVLHGTTVALGTGSADFEKVFSALKDVNYKESILLQAARGDEGDEAANIRRQLEFVKQYCGKYGMD